MTLGPLMDLAFEIYADLRNVGPIRHLPALINAHCGTPRCGTPTGDRSNRLSGSHLPDSIYQERTRTPTSSSISISPRASFNLSRISDFQELNSTLKPNIQASHLPAELYLALLHLCIQMPVYRISGQVVTTIISDMTSSAGYPLHRIDYHLAAALQCYHDSWMVCSSSEEVAGEKKEKCVYREWMYQSDEYVNEYIQQSLKNESNPPPSEMTPATSDEKKTCNDNLYWNIWSENDTALKDIRYTPERAEMLWKHISQVLL
jgi:hypothetical protein